MIARNPQTVHQPVADYTHQIEIADGGRWLVLSGQVGMEPDGTVPADPATQVETALENLSRNLDAAGMDVADLVKLTFYLVGEIDAAQRKAVVDAFLAGHRPCMTLLYVTALATPVLRVEIDAWAHHTDPHSAR